MAPKKRKSTRPEVNTAPVHKRGRGRPPNPNSALKTSIPPKRKSLPPPPTSSSSRPKRTLPETTEEAPRISRTSKTGGVSKPVAKGIKAAEPAKKATPAKPKEATNAASKSDKIEYKRRGSSLSVEIPHVYTTTADAVNEEAEGDDEDSEGQSYWLMKAEPESRIEKGKDVKFSIDDLKNATEPEAWDGVRNASARNNMRAMMKGDLSLFYHSNCKVPGIVGVMEIVEEHSVDESAFDPEHPYYDLKSTRDSPKWCCVKVEYRRKFPQILKLKELQRFGKEGGVLAKMQALRMSRLSVSKVSKKEWDFIMSLVDSDDGAESAANQPPTAS